MAAPGKSVFIRARGVHVKEAPPVLDPRFGVAPSCSFRDKSLLDAPYARAAGGTAVTISGAKK